MSVKDSRLAPSLTPSALLRALRPAQWTKNSFVLAPLVFARELNNQELIERAGLAVLAFCALASCVYLINDLRDREKDRTHPVKRHRPIASGALQARPAIAMAILLALTALATGLYLGTGFLVLMLSYLVLNLLYTFSLKHVVILDVMAIAGCYILRVLAGGEAVSVQVSSWILLCTAFLALFLIFSKRRHELVLQGERAGEGRAVLNHYSAAFLDQMINVVTASTLICYVLYTRDPETVLKFGTDRLLLTVPFVLFGIFRYLYLIYQKETERNPTEALMFDLPFLINLAAYGATVVYVLYS